MNTAIGLLLDFGKNTYGNTWRTVNDGVMGGLSESEIILHENSILFKGLVSLENNGGFASMRSLITKQSLTNCKTVSLRYRSNSNDRIFGLSLKNSQTYSIPYHKHLFSPKSTQWETIKLNLSDFKHYKISKIIGSKMPNKALEDVYNIAIIVSDGKSGAIDIEIDYIKFE